MEIRVYEELPEAAIAIRTAVFMEEQGFVNELDEIDHIAVHFVMYEDKIPVAACRVFRSQEKDSYVLGRLAVMKSCRSRGSGAAMIARAEQYVRERGGKSLALHSQCRAVDFYWKQGFMERGPIEEDEGCPHIWMYKELD